MKDYANYLILANPVYYSYQNGNRFPVSEFADIILVHIIENSLIVPNGISARWERRMVICRFGLVVGVKPF